jgi:hypothetical protein
VCGAAAASEALGIAPAVGNAAGLAAAALGPAVSTYTATLVSDTAVPAWHEAWPELPFVFAGSSAASAGGLGLLFAPVAENAPAARLAAGGGLMTLAAMERMKRRVGLVAEPYEHGRSGRLLKIAEVLTIAGSLAAAVGRRSALAARAGGAALLVGAACERFGIFDAGMASARDPKYTVVPQRQRLQARSAHD